jgi:hypothetical protein
VDLVMAMAHVAWWITYRAVAHGEAHVEAVARVVVAHMAAEARAAVMARMGAVALGGTMAHMAAVAYVLRDNGDSRGNTGSRENGGSCGNSAWLMWHR